MSKSKRIDKTKGNEATNQVNQLQSSTVKPTNNTSGQDHPLPSRNKGPHGNKGINYRHRGFRAQDNCPGTDKSGP